MRNLCLGLLTLLSTNMAMANDLCEKAHLYNLNLAQGDEKYSEVCEKSDSELSAREKQILEEISGINQELAELFETDVETLFEDNYSLNINEDVGGFLFSQGDDTSVDLGSFPNTGFAINRGVLLHEMGHLLSGREYVSEYIYKLSSSELFTEMFADLISLSIEGKVITPGEESSCIDTFRIITNSQTYDMPEEYFGNNFGLARVIQCCKSVVRTTKVENYKNFCSAIIAKNEMPQMSFENRLNPDSNIRTYDQHQIGIPTLSFFKEFSKKSQISLKEIFKLGFLADDHSTASYACQLVLNGKIVQNDEFQAVTVGNFFKDLRNKISENVHPLYDELFQRHAIQKGIELADKNLNKDVASDYKIETMIKINNDRGHACYGKMSFSVESEEFCQVFCKPLL